MIDWVTVKIPFPHVKSFNDGCVMSISESGEVDWKTEKYINVKGSYDSNIKIKSLHDDHPCSHILLDGNPSKFLQGHNVWGSDNLIGLLSETLFKIFEILEHPVDFAFIPAACKRGVLSRVDINYMYDVGSPERVMSFLDNLGNNASLSYRGRGIFSGDTLYFGKRSRRWALKMYAKGKELRSHKPKSFTPSILESVTSFADKAVRIELVLRGLELKHTSLGIDHRVVNNWKEDTPELLYSSYLSKLQVSDNMKVLDSELDDKLLGDLPPRLRSVLLLWQQGQDLKSLYPKNTYYRYRRELKEAIDLDINVPSGNTPEKKETSNVVSFPTVIEAKSVSVPDWAVGTDLYFEPRYIR